MATIVQLSRASALKRPERSKSDRGAPGVVVLFPGVRYERAGEPASSGRARSSRKRDRLDLED